MFSRFGSLRDGEETRNAVDQSSARPTVTEHTSSSRIKGSVGVGGGGHGESSSGRKKTVAKKSKPQQLERISFDECVREVS